MKCSPISVRLRIISVDSFVCVTNINSVALRALVVIVDIDGGTKDTDRAGNINF